VKNYHIRKLSEYKNNKIIEFYKKVFFNRDEILINNFNWCYRLGFSQYEPLIIELNNNIIGHAGLIPVHFYQNQKKEDFIWFTDFIILPEFQKRGFGEILTEEWMQICKNKITFCNDLSLKIFLKKGWQVINNYERAIYPINIFKLLPILNKLNLSFLDKLFKKLIVKKIKNYNFLNTYKLIEKNIEKIISLEQIKINKSLSICRDENWFKWRLIDYPYFKDLIIFEYEEDVIIARLVIKNNLKKINILLSYGRPNSQIYKLVLVWCIENNIDFIWSVNNHSCLNKFQSIIFKKKVNFAYNITDNIYFKNNIDLRAIDSDIEYI